MEYHRLDLVEQGIESFEGLDERSPARFLCINLQRNKLESFEHFGTHPYLSELFLQHNQLQSFRGLTKQASLRLLCLRGCPIAAHPYYRLMALLTVGLGIEAIDGLPITSQERHIAKSLGKRAALAVSYGWLLDLRRRTVDEYDAIISNFKKLRKDERRQMRGLRHISINSVLASLSKIQQSRGDDATVVQQLEERQRTITRLARRVAQLEGQLTGAVEGHVIPFLPPNQLNVTSLDGARSTSGGLFSAAELALVDTVCFSRGIQLRHNLSTTQGGLERVCLLLDHATLTVQAFINRDTLVQMPLRALRVRHLRPLSLAVEDDVGGALELAFETLPLLHTVYKTLFVLSARPIPPLSTVTQRQLQAIEKAAEKQPKSITAITLPAALDVGSSASRASSSEKVKASVTEEAAAVSRGGASQSPTRNVASASASVRLDNVEDVPPLPAAFSRPTATGGTDSTVFFVGETSHITAEGVAQPSVMQQPNSIELYSVMPSNREDSEADMNGVKSSEQAAPVPRPKGKLFANLLVNSSTSSDSAVFQTDDAKPSGKDNAALEPAPPRAAASPPSVAPRPILAEPPRPPPRRSPASTPADSAATSTTKRSAAGPPAPPTVPPRLSTTQRMEKDSRNSSIAHDIKPFCGVGESAATLHMADSAKEEQAKGKGEAANCSKIGTALALPAAAVEASRPRVPSRFRAMLIDSDSDSVG
ncbi:hypothetical protein ABL78_1520 [Leptomonas seymouri]|uniref:Leucine-rich repeat protein n=1 Tax=Leptomonas seymouri TaxID=5684 RepID=A0A0N1I0K7_LEPSE|nr:hypothetical protein ABL78_1520 [Leptomonas seymouri]|eukprot:KPI89394.1 hypothetical protein ABL78_1520 [Leptomonas seymouri]